MQRITSLVWAAVAVLGLSSTGTTNAAGPSGNLGSRGTMNRGGQAGGVKSQVLKTPVVNRNPASHFDKGGTRPSVLRPFPGGKPPVIDAGNGGGKPPKKPSIFNPFPDGRLPKIDPGNGGIKPPKRPPLPPVLDPGSGGGRPPKNPPVFDPYPGGKPPVLDPGNGGGKPPGGGNNPPGGGKPPGGGHGNGGGHGHGNGHGHGHHHGHHHHGNWWWPNYPLDWYRPQYYAPPYCGTVYLNGGWTYATQPVAVEQISLVQVGETLPEIPSNATFRMQVAGMAPTKGMAAVEINGVGMPAEVLEWNGDSVVVRLPSVRLTEPLVSQLYILQSDGSMAKNMKFKMLPAMEAAVAATN